MVLAQLDKLVEPLEKTLTAKLKSDAVKQEVGAGWPSVTVMVTYSDNLGAYSMS